MYLVILYPNIPRLIMSHNYTVLVALQSFDPLISVRYIYIFFLLLVYRLKNTKSLLQFLRLYRMDHFNIVFCHLRTPFNDFINRLITNGLAVISFFS